MKKVYALLLLSFFAFQGIFAQCTTCTPAFTGCKPAGGICNRAGQGMANHPYNTNINFYMPKLLTDPSILSQCQCSRVELKLIKISGIGGVPAGLQYTFNHTQSPYKGYYDVNNNDTLGCVSICGTPLAAGVYPIEVFIEANVLAVGTPIGNVDPGPQNQKYYDTIVILPDTSGSVASFTYNPQVKEDCDSIRLSFSANANFAAPSPNPTGYVWNFGNGVTSTSANPLGTQFYNSPGTYPVSLRTTYYQYRIKKVFITSVSGGWGDICDIACAGTPPDIYLKFNSLGFNNEGSQQGSCSNINFSNLNLNIPLGTSSINMEIWDDDASPINACGADDQIGTYALLIPTTPPYQVNFSNGNANGYVEFDTITANQFTDTLKVWIKGRPAAPDLYTVKDSICEGDSVRLSISPAYSNVRFDWFKDSVALNTVTDSFTYAKQAGKYKVIVTDLATGCVSVLDSQMLSVGKTPPSGVAVLYYSVGDYLYLNPAISTTDFTVRWFKDGLEISGQSGKTLPNLGDGSYYAIVYNPLFPECTVTTQVFALSTIGINEINDVENMISVLPNPNKGKFTVKVSQQFETGHLSIHNLLGQKLYEETLEKSAEKMVKNIDLDGIQQGVYVLEMQIDSRRISKRIIVE